MEFRKKLLIAIAFCVVLQVIGFYVLFQASGDSFLALTGGAAVIVGLFGDVFIAFLTYLSGKRYEQVQESSDHMPFLHVSESAHY